MSATEKYRKQHADLAEVLERIKPLLDPAKLASGLAELRVLLSSLFGKLSMHLAMEDQALYPKLLKHADAEVREMATKFSGEMSNMKPAVDAFAQKWSDNAIRTDMPGFCAETQKLFATLTDRLKRENTQFYALVDQRTT